MMIGTGAAMAGLGGLAAAAVTVNNGDQAAAAKAGAPVVETRTVVVRTVEHRVQRLKARHHQLSSPAAATATVAPAPAPVVQAAPVSVAQTAAPVSRTAPIRTSTSGSSGRSGGDDATEHENAHQGGDDGAEHADD
jgi:cell envelope opacity-associated protein A